MYEKSLPIFYLLCEKCLVFEMANKRGEYGLKNIFFNISVRTKGNILHYMKMKQNKIKTIQWRLLKQIKVSPQVTHSLQIKFI